MSRDLINLIIEATGESLFMVAVAAAACVHARASGIPP